MQPISIAAAQPIKLYLNLGDTAFSFINSTIANKQNTKEKDTAVMINSYLYGQCCIANNIAIIVATTLK